ncbi:hypothetical protein HGA34_00855 [Candidatus Falkowbacteria bacterium]|nr:hypothetical protein [Candidatus Falkowbacteria bacterium]
MKIDWHLVRQSPQEAKNKITAIAKSLWSFFYIRVYLVLIVILNILNWSITTFLQYRVKLDQVVLHYNVDFGVDLYGETSRLFIIPLIGLLVLFVNLSVVANTDRQSRFISHCLLATAAATNFLLLVAQLALYFYNLR